MKTGMWCCTKGAIGADASEFVVDDGGVGLGVGSGLPVERSLSHVRCGISFTSDMYRNLSSNEYAWQIKGAGPPGPAVLAKYTP